jgi:hypothetical protein
VFAREFENEFSVEKEVVARGGKPAELGKRYASVPVAGAPDAARPVHMEWADVGFMTLFVNRNYAGKPLKIGAREFARGFWAHAPSVLVFELDGKYQWFDTSFGLDALAILPTRTIARCSAPCRRACGCWSSIPASICCCGPTRRGRRLTKRA